MQIYARILLSILIGFSKISNQSDWLQKSQAQIAQHLFKSDLPEIERPSSTSHGKFALKHLTGSIFFETQTSYEDKVTQLTS